VTVIRQVPKRGHQLVVSELDIGTRLLQPPPELRRAEDCLLGVGNLLEFQHIVLDAFEGLCSHPRRARIPPDRRTHPLDQLMQTVALASAGRDIPGDATLDAERVDLLYGEPWRAPIAAGRNQDDGAITPELAQPVLDSA